MNSLLELISWIDAKQKQKIHIRFGKVLIGTGRSSSTFKEARGYTNHVILCQQTNLNLTTGQ